MGIKMNKNFFSVQWHTSPQDINEHITELLSHVNNSVYQPTRTILESERLFPDMIGICMDRVRKTHHPHYSCPLLYPLRPKLELNHLFPTLAFILGSTSLAPLVQAFSIILNHISNVHTQLCGTSHPLLWQEKMFHNKLYKQTRYHYPNCLGAEVFHIWDEFTWTIYRHVMRNLRVRI